MVTKEEVMKTLKNVMDPELSISVVDMGFIEDIKMHGGNVHIKMTLTNPACPMSGMIAEQVKSAVQKMKDIKTVEVELVFDKAWTPKKMSNEARKKLGF